MSEYGKVDREGIIREYFTKDKEKEWKEEVLRWACTRDAKEKLNNVRVVDIERYKTIRDIMFRSYKMGRLKQNKIDVPQLRQMLVVINRMTREQRMRNWMDEYARPTI